MAQNTNQVVERPLKKWEDILKENHIDFESFEDHLYAETDKHDGEGYYVMRLNIYYTESTEIYANFSALGEVIHKLPPDEAISKFRTYKSVYFSE